MASAKTGSGALAFEIYAAGVSVDELRSLTDKLEGELLDRAPSSQ